MIHYCTACTDDLELVTNIVRWGEAHVAVTTVLVPENANFREVHLCAQHTLQWHFYRRLIYGTNPQTYKAPREVGT